MASRRQPGRDGASRAASLGIPPGLDGWSKEARVAVWVAGALLMLALGAFVGVRASGGEVQGVFETQTVKVRERAREPVTVTSVVTAAASADQSVASDPVTVTVPTTVTTTVRQTDTVTVTEPETSGGTSTTSSSAP